MYEKPREHKKVFKPMRPGTEKPLAPLSYEHPTEQILVLREKVDALERWRQSTEADLKEIHEVISQVRLLMSLALGGGGLSVITLLVTLANLAKELR